MNRAGIVAPWDDNREDRFQSNLLKAHHVEYVIDKRRCDAQIPIPLSFGVLLHQICGLLHPFGGVELIEY